MTKRRRTSWRCSKRGLTLIEVVLGTAILGTLLVAILLSASRLQASAARADRRIEACRVADSLLETWWAAKPEDFPRAASGTVGGAGGWSWRTTLTENPESRAMKAETVALEIFAPGAPKGEPAVRVEVVLPEKTDAPEKGTDAR